MWGEVKRELVEAVSYFAVFPCVFAPWRDCPTQDTGFSRKDAKYAKYAKSKPGHCFGVGEAGRAGQAALTRASPVISLIAARAASRALRSAARTVSRLVASCFW